MAKHTARKSFRKYLKGNVDETLGLGTLAAQTLTGTDYDESVNERTFISSHKATWSISDWTPGAGIGPVLVGIAHGDYTNAEVEEVIENTGSWNEGDKVAQEVAKRQIRIVGKFESPEGGSTFDTILNEGKPIHTKLNWILNQGETLRLWAYNLGSQPFATTDPQVRISGHVNLWPGK